MFSSLMHVAFYTEHFDEMMDFYTNKLGLPVKVLTRFSSYRDPSLGFSTIIFGSNLMPVVSVTSIFAGFFISKKT